MTRGIVCCTYHFPVLLQCRFFMFHIPVIDVNILHMQESENPGNKGTDRPKPKIEGSR